MKIAPAFAVVLALALALPLFAQEDSARDAGSLRGQAGIGELDPADRVSIHAAFEQARHRVFEIDGGHQVRNPGQRFSTVFDGRGATTTPAGGGFTWGLELAGYGWAGAERGVERPLGVAHGGGRIAYEWDELLTEWYVNDRRGLEHGFTVHARPPAAQGSLSLEFRVRGDLQPQVTADGRSVHFVDAECGTRLTYAGLTVFDAEGGQLGAGWQVRDGSLRLFVHDEDAPYPLTIDPLVQRADLRASNAAHGDQFGTSVAIHGNTIVVGAPWEDSSATGVNGNQADDGAHDAGAAYVFVGAGSTWVQQAYLKASNTGAGDYFGVAVAIDGDTIVVGARGEQSHAFGVDGDQSDNSWPHAGAAYVFVRSGSTWSQQAYLKASNTGYGDAFGGAVAIGGDTIVVGAIEEDSNSTGVNGPQQDDSATMAGAAYVFVRNGTTWSQQAYLKASNTGAGDRFGFAVGVDGDTVAVGASLERSNAVGVNGDGSNDSAVASGAAYVFVRNGIVWTQEAYLKASNTASGDSLGRSIAISGETVVVGAYGEDSASAGVDGDQADNDAESSGAAYVFVRTGTGWSQQAYLKASNPGQEDHFGWSVSISADTIVVGAQSEDSHATGVNGDGTDNSSSNAGAAYVFQREAGSWSQTAYLKAADTDSGDQFGNAVSIQGGSIVVGAYLQGPGFTDITGAAYVFSSSDPSTAFCFGDGSAQLCPCGNSGSPGHGCANSVSGSGALLIADGTASVSGNSVTFAAAGSCPNQAGLFYQGNNALNGGLGQPFGDGLRCAGGGLVRLEVCSANAAGEAQTTIDIGAAGGAGAGQTLRYQWWYRDPFGSLCGSGFNLSNGIELSWEP